jgi:hypothetical protein
MTMLKHLAAGLLLLLAATAARAEEKPTQSFDERAPDCAEWSDGCIVCAKQADGEIGCSTPGVACTPREPSCDVPKK